MRRPPPDKDGHSALSEVDSSNATLNTLFGARQKSWMMGAGTPVRPTPRTSISKPSATPQVTAVQRNTAAVLPSPAPSDELSPALPSTPPSERQRAISNHENRQPSLASILLPQSGQARVGALGGSENTETQAQNSTTPQRSYNQARRPTNPALEEPQLQRSLTDNPPLPSSLLLSEDRHQYSPIAATFNGGESHRQPSHIQPGSPAAVHVQGVSSNPAFPSLLLPQGPQPLRQSQVRPLSPAQPNAPSPVVPSSTTSPIQTSSNSGSSLSNPYKRQRTQPAIMPSLQPRINLIEQHIASSGGRENLNSGLERPRFQLLIDACRNEDSFYVAVHQLFCVWDTMPSEISRIGGAFSDANLLTLAFKILGQLIRDNDQLAVTHKRWFSQFPSPLPDLLRTSGPYRAVVADVGVFLTKLATDWNTLSNDCNTRKFPPLVDELVDRMGLLSPILQGVVFTATRRNIEISDGEFAIRMEELFRQDQKDHQALSARINTARPPTLREVQERNHKLKSEYLALYGQFMQQRLGSSSRLQTPILPSSSHSQSRPQPTSQNQSLQQPNWNPSIPSPDPTNNWHLPVQQSQAIQRTSSSSPNPNMVNRRPPSVGSHQVLTTAPSPTLLQGLHVHSPVQQGFQVRNNSAQTQPHQNVAFHPGPTRQEVFYQAPSHPVSPTQPHRPQMTPQQHAVQQQQQALINQQQQQLAMQQQAQLQQQAQWQHQNNLQHQQQVLNLGIQSLNRATQRRDSNVPIDLQQQMHSRANSIGSGGRQTPSINSMAGPLPRPLGQPAGSRIIPPVAYDQGQVEIINYNQIAPIQRPLVPPLGYVAPSQPTNPDLSALHQAHLRSPRLVASVAKPTEMTQDDPAHRYYQAVKGFALHPTKISSSVPMSKFDFMVPAADYALIPSDVVHSNGQVATREFRNGTLQYRLRCVQMKRNEVKCAVPDWVVSDTVWPESASLDINKHQLEIRRKNHHGKDLPIDITRFIRDAGPDSSSRISLSILRGRTKMKEFQYFLAVEIVEILHHAEILDLCQQNHIPESFTLNKIKKSLAGPAPGDDDDFAMVISDLAIDLADPFTARIFEIPVRGNTCLHRECFDLKTFLLTRNSKVKRPEQPCMIDTWKCPLCGKDARPYSLQIDDFLASVRVSLEDQGLLDVKAIWIGPDGKWRPKIEESTGIADDESSDDEASSKQKAMADRSKKTIQVIELDDD